MKVYIVVDWYQDSDGLIESIEYVTTSEDKVKQYTKANGWDNNNIITWELYD